MFLLDKNQEIDNWPVGRGIENTEGSDVRDVERSRLRALRILGRDLGDKGPIRELQLYSILCAMTSG
jgi:hypothetical protein